MTKKPGYKNDKNLTPAAPPGKAAKQQECDDRTSRTNQGVLEESRRLQRGTAAAK